MSKVIIYLFLNEGKLHYRDSENHSGQTIETNAKPGDKVTWTLDKKSGISDISGINILGDCKFFLKGPAKKSCDKWEAKVSKKAKGEIEYQLFVIQSDGKKSSLSNIKSLKSTDNDPPKIIVRI